MLYNAKLRGFPRELCNTLQPRDYTTTIHAINSAILKISMASPVPRDGLTYRGMKGVKLPQRFWGRDATGCKGGTERGFCSTTTDMQVALHYASGGVMPVLFQVPAQSHTCCSRWFSCAVSDFFSCCSTLFSDQRP